MTIIFFGSDDFAAHHLERLLGSSHKVSAVVTQADKARGRHLKISELPVKETALRHSLKVFQPEQIQTPDFLESLRNLQPDIIVVIAYGKILPESVLNIPRKFCVNVHASLLPKYRGASPIHWAVINGDKTSGVSIIKMNAKMDAGEIIARKETAIADDDTTVSLKRKLADLGGELLLETLSLIEKGEHILKPQDESKVTYVAKLTKDIGKIDWSKPAVEIHNRVRGLVPWPGASTLWQGKSLKVLETKVLEDLKADSIGGQVFRVAKDGLDVTTGQGILRITRIHPESSKAMDAYSFAQGHRLAVGQRFGP